MYENNANTNQLEKVQVFQLSVSGNVMVLT